MLVLLATVYVLSWTYDGEVSVPCPGASPTQLVSCTETQAMDAEREFETLEAALEFLSEPRAPGASCWGSDFDIWYTPTTLSYGSSTYRCTRNMRDVKLLEQREIPLQRIEAAIEEQKVERVVQCYRYLPEGEDGSCELPEPEVTEELWIIDDGRDTTGTIIVDGDGSDTTFGGRCCACCEPPPLQGPPPDGWDGSCTSACCSCDNPIWQLGQCYCSRGAP